MTVHQRGEEERAGRLEWVEMSVRGDLWKKDSSKSDREGVYDDSNTLQTVALTWDVAGGGRCGNL